jgi:hypothetical protein
VRPTSNIPQERLITVYGAVTEIEHLDTQTARIQLLNTFDETYSSQHIYKTPDVIFDQIHHLYQRGHRHIFYVAQAPYSSTIRVARASQNADLDDENGGLFFLSRDIVKRCVQGKPDLHIYPVFRDQYHAMKLSALDAATLYTQDVEELMRVVGDKSQQMVVFLNLFSGLPNVADRDGVDKYHGVVSYATLLNVFEDILGSRSIYAALIQDDNGQNALKSMLVHYLMLFHLSQYQARRNEIAIKLDPYDMIIGEKSVGVAASQSHASRSLRFNFLAFLSFVRKIIKAGDGK